MREYIDYDPVVANKINQSRYVNVKFSKKKHDKFLNKCKHRVERSKYSMRRGKDV